MASIDKRSNGHRVRYRDPVGKSRSRSFRRKSDADRFAREVEVDKAGGQRIDPRGADMPLADWSTTFLSLARSLAPTTQETYRRDLDGYVLPRFGPVRIGRIEPEDVEEWLNDELEADVASSSVHRHHRTLRRVLQAAVEKESRVREFQPTSSPTAGSRAAGRRTRSFGSPMSLSTSSETSVRYRGYFTSAEAAQDHRDRRPRRVALPAARR